MQICGICGPKESIKSPAPACSSTQSFKPQPPALHRMLELRAGPPSTSSPPNPHPDAGFQPFHTLQFPSPSQVLNAPQSSHLSVSPLLQDKQRELPKSLSRRRFSPAPGRFARSAPGGLNPDSSRQRGEVFRQAPSSEFSEKRSEGGEIGLPASANSPLRPTQALLIHLAALSSLQRRRKGREIKNKRTKRYTSIRSQALSAQVPVQLLL